jgi:pilus assembly protein Flp/PilA
MRRVIKFLKDDRGASAVEYGLLVSLVAAVIVGAVTLLGESESNLQLCSIYRAEAVNFPFEPLKEFWC